MKNKALAYSNQNKMEIKLNAPLDSQEDLSLAYTPGIAEVVKAVQDDPQVSFTHTFRRNNLAVISDGSAVLGLGNVGSLASYPVMEGKSMLFKKFADIDAIPVVVDTQEIEAFIATVKNIAPSFGAINLEDIAAPKCFEIEKRLKNELDIPVMHDDQHGTAIVILAGLKNALQLIPKNGLDTKIIVSGTGSAGIAAIRILYTAGFSNILAIDSTGIISPDRKDLNPAKTEMLQITNSHKEMGSLEDAVGGADVFIGVSKGGVLTQDMVRKMNPDPIIIAMANPIPEIMPDEASEAGAGIIATGRSDFPNQVNNALAFPGVFRAAIDTRHSITEQMKLAAANAIVEYHQKDLSRGNLMPKILDLKIHQFIADKVSKAVKA